MFTVVPLTLAISLILVATFVFFFWREHSRHRFDSSESESLLPLAPETPRIDETKQNSKSPPAPTPSDSPGTSKN